MSAGPAVSTAAGRQPAAPETSEPTAQLVHAAEPLQLYVLAGHGAQIEAPGEDENEPAAQAVHPPALTVPGLVTAPKKPGVHTVHADTAALPAAPDVVVTPAGQAVQPAAFSVPGLVTEP